MASRPVGCVDTPRGSWRAFCRGAEKDAIHFDQALSYTDGHLLSRCLGEQRVDDDGEVSAYLFLVALLLFCR